MSARFLVVVACLAGVAVAGPDVGVSRIIAPVVPIDSNQPIMPACSVYNHGTETVSYDVRMSVGEFYERTTAVSNHEPGTPRYVAFPIYLAWPRGTHLVRCSTRLNGDIDNANDRQLDSVPVRVRDVSCFAIPAPTGTVDSGAVITPACSVYNHGTTTVTYPVRMRIGADYVQGATVIDHAPGTGQYLEFPAWTAETLGVQAVRCSTRLTGDLVNTNDRLDDSVTVIPPTGIAGPPRTPANLAPATLVSGVLFLPDPSTGYRQSVLMNAAGRRVMDLGPGPNDIGRVSAGVYFVLPAEPGAAAGGDSRHRILVTR